MKIGQLLSLETGELLPPVLSETLSRLRDSAHVMPLGQVAQVLNHAWGENWDRRFHRFSFTPIAAASIGQVHKAILREGQHVAVKIQYPGIRESIDSDIDNVGTLLRLTGLLGDDFDLSALLNEGKRELHLEADCLEEARFIERFQDLLSDDHRFQLPTVFKDLTTPKVLTMSHLDGEPIDVLLEMEQKLRDSADSVLLELGLFEVFRWGLVQTDPQTYRSGIVALLRTATEPLRAPEPYTVGSSNLAERMSEIFLRLRLREKAWRFPRATYCICTANWGVSICCSADSARRSTHIDSWSRSCVQRNSWSKTTAGHRIGVRSNAWTSHGMTERNLSEIGAVRIRLKRNPSSSKT